MSLRGNGRLPDRFISFGYIGLPEQVVDIDVIESGKLNENRRGNIVFPGLILGVAGLGHVQISSDLGLIHIVVFPQVSNTAISQGDQPPFFLKKYA